MATIQGVYLALFGRPADPLGLQFFNTATNNGANLAGIGPLQSSAEYQARFQGQTNVQIINSIYQSLFNRDADLPGLTFFSNALASGSLSINNIAIAIYDGAQGADLTIRNLKEAAASAFTTAVDTTAEVVGYNGNAAAASARAFIASVTTTAPTAAQVDAAVLAATSVGGGAGSGATFTLTTGLDFADSSTSFLNGTIPANFKFTNAGETIQALNGTLNTTDVLQDSATTDTDVLKATVATAGNLSVTPTLANIERIEVVLQNAGAAGTLNMTNVTGAKAVVLSGTATSAGVNNFASSGVTSVDGSAVTAGDLTITPTNNTTVALTLKGGAGNDTLAGSAGADIIDGGAGNDTISGGAGANKLTGGAGNDTISAGNDDNTVDAGAGNDGVTLGAGKNTVELGTGTDTLTAGNGANTVTDSDGGATVTVGNGANTITLGATANTVTAGSGANVITTGAGGDTISVGNGGNTIVSGGGADTITFAAAGTGVSTLTAGTGADIVDLGTTGGAITVNFAAGDTGITATTIDLYSNFITGNDKFKFGIAAGDAINFTKDAAADRADFAAALTAANAGNLGAGKLYFVTGTTDVDGVTAGNQAGVLVFIDRNNDGAADEAIAIVGGTEANTNFTDFI